MNVPSPSISPRKDGHLGRLQMFHRIPICGHLDKGTGMQLSKDRKKRRSISVYESSKECRTAEICPGDITSRCLKCATAAEDEKHQLKRPGIAIGSYRTEASSTPVGEKGKTPRRGLENVLECHRCSQKHRAFTETCLKALKKDFGAEHVCLQQNTRRRAVQPLGIPSANVWVAPQYTLYGAGVTAYNRNTVFLLDKAEHLSMFDVCNGSCNTQDNGVPEVRVPDESSGLCLRTYRTVNRDVQGLVRLSPWIDSVKECIFRSLWHTSNKKDSKDQPMVPPFRLTSGPELCLDTGNSTGDRRNMISSNPTVNSDSDLSANILDSFAEESALIEDLIEGYASLFDNSKAVDTTCEQLRPVYVLPEWKILRHTEHRAISATGAPTRSEPVSKNFRQLRLYIEKPTSFIHETQSDQGSPDWACQTSLAIEAGTMLMDDVYKHDPASKSRHIVEAMRNSNYFAWSCIAKVEEKTVKIKEGSLKHGSVQTTLPVDLNKSLPALPL